MKLIEMAREMGKEIQASDEYKKLKEAQTACDNDAALQDGIGKFNLKRLELNEVMQKEERDDKKLQALNEELQNIYTDVMGNSNMMAYNIAKQEIDEVMQQVNAILTMCVNGEDPETCEIPTGCSGSCSSCGGCH